MAALVDHATEHLLTARVTGYCFHSCFWYPFGQLNDPASWFNPGDFGDVKLKLTGAAGAGAVRVLTQQLAT